MRHEADKIKEQSSRKDCERERELNREGDEEGGDEN